MVATKANTAATNAITVNVLAATNCHELICCSTGRLLSHLNRTTAMQNEKIVIIKNIAASVIHQDLIFLPLIVWCRT